MSKKTVVVFGASGWLGGKVAKFAQERKDEANVWAFVRPSSNTKKLDELGIGKLTGNLYEKETILNALDPKNFGDKPVDAVVYSAATYMGRQSGDSQKRDYEAFQNLVAAVKTHKVRRFVLVSVVGCDQAPRVPHFHDKYRFEQLLAQEKVPFFSVRAPAFLDQEPGNDFFPPALIYNTIPAFGGHDIKQGFVLTDDFAHALVKAAIDLPQADLPLTLDITMDQDVTANEIAAEFSRVLGRPIVPKAPFPGALFVMGLAGKFHPLAHDLVAMFEFIGTGKYVTSAEGRALSTKYFGPLRSVRSSVETYVAQIKARGIDLSEKPAGWTSRLAVASLVAGAAFVAYKYVIANN